MTKPEDLGKEEKEHVIYEMKKQESSSSDAEEEILEEAPAEGPPPPSVALPAQPQKPPARPHGLQASQAAKASQAVPRSAPAKAKPPGPVKAAGDGWSLSATKTEAADAAGPKMPPPPLKGSVAKIRKRLLKQHHPAPDQPLAVVVISKPFRFQQ